MMIHKVLDQEFLNQPLKEVLSQLDSIGAGTFQVTFHDGEKEIASILIAGGEDSVKELKEKLGDDEG